MSDAPERDPSRLRQSLRRAERDRSQWVETLLSERGPVIAGSYLTPSVRCGKPSCKCSRGELHSSGVLRSSDQGVASNTYVPVVDRTRVQQLNARYQSFRKARAELGKLGRRSLELAGELLQVLAEPYPDAGATRTAKAKKRRRRARRKESSS